MSSTAQGADRPPCTVPDCGRPHHANGLCTAHNQQRRRGVPLGPLQRRGTPALPCSVPDCGRPTVSRGLCQTHSCQARAGQPLTPIGAPSTEERFWSKVNKDGPTQPHMTTPCWLWTAATYNTYGAFRLADGVTEKAHRVSYVWAHGTIPDDLLVRHECDERLCVNPAHLLIGTVAENIADKVERGRQSRGESHGMSKLTEDDVRALRADAVAGMDRNALGAKYGITPSAASMIRRRRAWGHVA